jgi:hypothetical protein
MDAIQKPTPVSKRGSASVNEIATHIYSMFKDLQSKRRTVEKKWDVMYAMYRSNCDDMNFLSKESFTTGSTRAWKHKVNTGKTFEVVETLVAYFKGATFPSDDWFDASGLEPNLAQAAMLVKQLAKFKMEEARVRDVYEEWLRNLVIYGCSTFQVGWEECLEPVVIRTFDEVGLPVDDTQIKAKDKLVLKSVSPYNVWINGSGGTFSRLDISKEQIAYLVETGYYDLKPELLDVYEQGGKDNPNVLKNNPVGTEVIEYYGPLLLGGARYHCVHAVFYENTIIRLADSDYWCGSPYVTGVMLPDRDSVYGMTVLDPSAGALHTLNVLNNARLDNIAVSIDKMFTFVDDGIMRKEDIHTEPGKVFTVAQHGSIQPIDLGPPAFTLGYQEAQVQEGSIDRNCSTGPLIGGGQPRGGERVTAQEIIAVQESGGNRLASVHSHIEDSATSKLLTKIFSLMQQFVLTPQTVKVFLPDVDQYAFFELDPSYLTFPFEFKPNGAAYVVEKQRQIGDLMTLFDIAGRVPQLAEKLDFERILVEVLKHMRFTNPSSYIKAAPPPTPPAQEQQPQLDEVGIAALERSVAEDGGASLLGGVGIDASAMDPQQLQMMSQEALDYGTGTGTAGSLPDGAAGASIDGTGEPGF